MKKMAFVMQMVCLLGMSLSAHAQDFMSTSSYLDSGKTYHFRQWSNNKQLLTLDTTSGQLTYKYVDDAHGYFSVYQIIAASSRDTSMLMTASGNPVLINGQTMKVQAVPAVHYGKPAIGYVIVNHAFDKCLMGMPNPTWQAMSLPSCSVFEAVQIP